MRQAETECDVVIWDGGNNDFPFFVPNLQITVVDPLRPGHELAYYPGETCLLRADVVVVNKIDSAAPADLATVVANVERVNPRARIVKAASPVTLGEGPSLAGKRVLVIEDGPTITHGGMPFGAGTVAAHHEGAAEIIDPRPYAVGSIAETYARYPGIGAVSAGDGLWRRAVGRAWCHGSQGALRRRRDRHADGPGQAGRPRPSFEAGLLRAA